MLIYLIDVLEVPIDVNDPMAGYKYIVEHNRDSQREFSDLDELIVNYVKAMARKVEELMNHDKYKAQTPEQLGMLLFSCDVLANISLVQLKLSR